MVDSRDLTPPICAHLRKFRCDESYACDELFDEAADTIEDLASALRNLLNALPDVRCDNEIIAAHEILDQLEGA